MAGILKINELSPISTNSITLSNVYLDNSNCNTCMQIPRGTIAQRQSTPSQGTIRFNNDWNTLEVYDGYEWKPINEQGKFRALLVDAAFYSSGSVADYSVNNNSGLINGTVTKSTDGGGSFNFQNQNGSYISFSYKDAYNLASSNMTFMYWIKIDTNHQESSSTGARPWVIQNYTYPGIESFIGSAGLNVHSWFATTNASSWNILNDFGTNTMTVGTWYFAAITRNYSSGLYVSYWNGSSTASTVNTNSFNFIPNGESLRLGGNSLYFLRGKIAKAKMMNKELTSAQINNIWLSEKSRFGY